jgi:hypothetical protein
VFLVIEAGLTVLALVLAFTVPTLGSRWFEAIERSFGKLAKRRGLSVIVVGLTALALRVALLPILPIPLPGVQDEFCYLLLSDTFAHGRLTNPTSPMWVHFESPFILWHPTYTAKYWPAQGLIMAFGQALLGHPFWGVWLSVGLMCAAITWMLQAWVGERWALLGGFLAVIRFGTFNYWANGYWGGAVSAIGGALVLGALPRMKQEHRVRNALLMGLGFALLGNSRPYEGLFFGIPVAVALLVWLWKLKRPELGRALARGVVPLLAVLALTLVAMGYYFWRTTGSATTPPYLLYERTYNPVPNFPWMPMKQFPAYHNTEIHNFFVRLKETFYDPSRSVAGMARNTLIKFILLWAYFLGPVFTLPLALLPIVLPVGFSWRDVGPRARFLLAVCGAVVVANLLLTSYEPHYTAPAACAILALIVIAMRQVRLWRWYERPTGLFVTRAVPSICVLLLVFLTAADCLNPSTPYLQAGNVVPTWCWQSLQNRDRAEVLSQLGGYRSGQLVIVHYNSEKRTSNLDWVYNRADLNSAKVLWADDMGPAKNQELIDYFKDRRVWLLYADEQPPKLVPYSEVGAQPSLTATPQHP